MCAIIDNNVLSEAFGTKKTEAGAAFLEAVEERGLKLVVGGELLEELDGNSTFREWRRTAIQYGKVHIEDEQEVKSLTDELEAQGICESNDHHVIALAQISGARLLFSNDDALQLDFTSASLINGPRGKVYSTVVHKNLTKIHRQLLQDTTLCTKIDT